MSTRETCDELTHYHCERCTVCIADGDEMGITTTTRPDGVFVCAACLADFEDMLSDWLTLADDDDED